MRLRMSCLLLPALLAALAPFRAEAQNVCQWVCVNESCRLDQSVDATCDGGPTVLPVTSDADAVACLPEPVTLDMVTNSSSQLTFTSTLSDTMSPTSPTSPAAPAAPPAGQAQAPPVAPPPAKPDVLLTGFCKFGNLTENPTERILPALEKAVKAQCGANINLKSQCLNVNVKAIQNCKVKNQIVISLGVDDGSGSFRMETSAANCFVDYTTDPSGKTVACPPVCIDPAKALTNTIEAPGPWPTLPPKIGTYPIIKGKTGTAGDYVCNATYYWLCSQKECKPYFIHTPNFTSDQDKDVVAGLAKLICDTIAANQPPAAKSAPVSTAR